jgi:hypothetical protein
MRNKSFGDFVDKKRRDTKRQLGLIEQLLKKQGLRTEGFLENSEDDPYVFCYNPSKSASFDGIRIYKIADIIAFRIQKESKTHPYGAAYSLPIEEMFQDFLNDEKIKEQEAGHKVIEAVSREVRKFFDKSSEAERDERMQDIEGGSQGNVAIRGQANDYASMIYSKS